MEVCQASVFTQPHHANHTSFHTTLAIFCHNAKCETVIYNIQLNSNTLHHKKLNHIDHTPLHWSTTKHHHHIKTDNNIKIHIRLQPTTRDYNKPRKTKTNHARPQKPHETTKSHTRPQKATRDHKKPHETQQTTRSHTS